MTLKVRVVNIIGNRKEHDVYIGRPSKWGNPFVIGRDGDRTECISKYFDWIFKQEELIRDLPELQDKVLGCYCAPQPCHGDILAELVEAVTAYPDHHPRTALANHRAGREVWDTNGDVW